MKTERRHELQTNVLADRLARSAETIKPYGKTILGAVLLVMLAVVVLSFWNTRQRQRVVQGWDEFFSAFSSGNELALETTAKEYSGTPVANWAKLIEADMTLAEATDLLFSNPAEGRGKLRDAADVYQTLAKNTDDAAIRQRATFGLAEAHESLGELEKARGEYDTVVKNWPDSPHARVARQRSRALGQQKTKEFYDWMAKYTPSSGASSLPGVPGVGPNFDRGLDSEMPSRPGDISLPSILDNPPAGDSTNPTTGDSPSDITSPITDPADDATKGDAPETTVPDSSPRPGAGDNSSSDSSPAADSGDAAGESTEPAASDSK